MRLSPDRKAGLYITAIIHLAVIIVLLSVRLGYEIQRENTFVLDFSKQEEAEKQAQKEEQERIRREKREMHDRVVRAEERLMRLRLCQEEAEMEKRLAAEKER